MKKDLRMVMVPKPRIGANARNIYIYIALLLAGIIISFPAYRYGPSASFMGKLTSQQAARSGFDHGPPAESTLTLAQKPPDRGFIVGFLFLIFIGIGITFSTVSILELAKHILEVFDYRRRHGAKFNEFFGDDAHSRSADGVIHLRSNDIGDPHFAAHPTPSSATGRPGTYKARHWVNRWDMEGTISIRKMFRDGGMEAPGFYPTDTAGQGQRASQFASKDPPFVIEMGLGFFDLHDNLTSDLRSWMTIDKEQPLYGDSLRVLEDFLPLTMLKLQPYDRHHNQPYRIDGTDVQIEPIQGFLPILPKEWNYGLWLTHPEESDDYALVLRRTYRLGEQGPRQVHLVLAGFTERGTAVAAKYLAAKWDRLWEDYVKGKHASKDAGYGDFLLVIAGKSDIDQALNWQRVFKIEYQDVIDKNCDWPHPENMGPPVIAIK